jgi:predicted Rossmann fold nucleotide-binding protein DprA/Smf involved in DNA uptake
MRMRHIVICGLSDGTVFFPHYPTKGAISEKKKVTEHKTHVFILPFNYENNQQDAVYRLIYYSKSALHVSGDVFAHHQEHLTVFIVSSSVHQCRCRLVSWMTK